MNSVPRSTGVTGRFSIWYHSSKMYTERTSRCFLRHVTRFPANQWLSCVISAIRTLGRMCNRDKGWCHGLMDKVELKGGWWRPFWCCIHHYSICIPQLQSDYSEITWGSGSTCIWIKKCVYVSVCVHLSVPAVISVEWGFGKVRKHSVHSSNDLNWSRWASLTHSEWRCLLHRPSVQHEWKNELMPSNTTDFIYWH